MSCPETNWRDALAHRFDPDQREPDDWEALQTHLETCDTCRREAVGVDPSLLFALRVTAPETDARDEAAAMQHAVAGMRRAARVERRAEQKRSGLDRLRSTPWTRWAAAAVLTVAGLTYGSIGLDVREEDPEAPPAPARAASMDPSSSLNAAHVPVFEGLDRPEARVYDWTSEDADVAVLMIVDENLDV